MATKHCKIVTYRGELSPINPINSLNMWPCEVTWQIKNISPLSQFLWLPNLSGYQHTKRSSHPKICMTPQWGGLPGTLDKLNNLYLHLQRLQEHQARQRTGLPWEAPTTKATWSFDQMTMQGHVTVWRIYGSTFIWLVASKLGQVLTSRRRFSTWMLKLSLTYCYLVFWLVVCSFDCLISESFFSTC